MSRTVTIPRDFTPRPYQLNLLRAMDSGIRHAIICWHRRSGKDLVCLNYLIKRMVERKGLYYILFPTFNQGRKVLWDGVTNTGARFLEAFPEEYLASKPNETEMQITGRNGSIFQIIGTDDYNKIMGTNPCGLIYSEFMLQDPKARAFIMPILAANAGWEILNFTPRGANNHATELFEKAVVSPQDWFAETLTIDDTQDERGQPIVSEAELARIRRDQEMTEEEIQQEFYVNFIGALEGLIYGNEMARADAEGRIGKAPFDAMLDVETWWDFGRDDANAIWFVQRHRKERRFIDYYEERFKDLPHFVKVCRDWAQDHRAVFSGHYTGWDAVVHDHAGKTRIQAALDLKLRPAFTAAKKRNPMECIDAVRRVFPSYYFDAHQCRDGIKALRAYKREWDVERRTHKNEPVHNWASHAADALRNGEMASYEPRPQPFQTQAITDFDVFSDTHDYAQEVA